MRSCRFDDSDDDNDDDDDDDAQKLPDKDVSRLDVPVSDRWFSATSRDLGVQVTHSTSN